ncbi:DUF6234 family protein [Streptomyces sp. NPDC051576]|uniref:DUF6234 family protein n=1 Tax=Streptomyces sp. NPDC051576 TaxID=3155803 RepID=UPI00343AA289
MTQVLAERPSRRGRRPWSHRTPLRRDITAAVLLFLGEAAVFVWTMFGYGMTVWAAQGEQDRIDAATLASITWTEHFFYVVLALAALAALSRAPWTLVSHLLTALLLAALFTGAQHDWDLAHPDPAPTPSAHYTPCLSGSGECH